MSGTLAICHVPRNVKEELEQFRFNKSRSTNALILKIEREEQRIVLENKLEDCTIEEICDELPSQQPRFILISFEYNHTDGRVSLPLCFVFYTPDGCHPDLQMLYAGSRNHFVSECELTKNFEIRDAEELTQELLNSKMA